MNTTTAFSTLEWGKTDLTKYPNMAVPAPGPQSKAWHDRCTKYFKGLSGQVKLFPVTFDSGESCVLRDVDGNEYIDFSSGIYVTTLGHCHPKISEAVAKAAHKLMNAHDFTSPVKTELMEKLAEVLPGDLNGFQLYDSGTTAVEAGMRVMRAATGKNEMISCFNDYHGKTYGAVSLGHIRSNVYGRVRAPGAHMVPRPDAYRPMWTKPDGTIDTDAYLTFYDAYLDKGTVGDVAGFVLEPIQGWGGSVMPPDDFFPKLRKFCDQRGLLLMIDEVLTSWGRTGKFLCMEHWDVVPDIVTIGKGFGNGFPVTCVAVRDQYKESFEAISASSSYGGNPMACAARLDPSDRGGEPQRVGDASGQRGTQEDERDEGTSSDYRRREGEGMPHGHRTRQGSHHQGALRQGGNGSLPEGLRKRSGMDPRRPHPAHEPADRHG